MLEIGAGQGVPVERRLRLRRIELESSSSAASQHGIRRLIELRPNRPRVCVCGIRALASCRTLKRVGPVAPTITCARANRGANSMTDSTCCPFIRGWGPSGSMALARSRSCSAMVCQTASKNVAAVPEDSRRPRPA